MQSQANQPKKPRLVFTDIQRRTLQVTMQQQQNIIHRPVSALKHMYPHVGSIFELSGCLIYMAISPVFTPNVMYTLFVRWGAGVCASEAVGKCALVESEREVIGDIPRDKASIEGDAGDNIETARPISWHN